jgi:hypothetical protein
MFYPEPRTPRSSDFELINAAGHTARIAIDVETIAFGPEEGFRRNR